MQHIHEYCFQQLLNHLLTTEIPKDIGTLPDVIYIRDKWLAAVIAAKRYNEGLKPITIIIIN